MEKDFDNWGILKKKLDSEHKSPTFKEGEVWWCSIGLNIGHEADGKNEFFNRPIVVIKKFNRDIFLGIPLTTKIKENKFYYKMHFKGDAVCAMLSQIRILTTKRLSDKMGEMKEGDFFSLRNQLKKVIFE